MHFADGVLHIGSTSTLDLAERFGTPLYVYDSAVLRRQIDHLKRAFGALPFRPFYAMKANSALAILRMVHGAGFGADAVSPGEIFRARRAAFEPDQIWFTCSNVSDEDLRAIGDTRIVINVNSMSEIDRVLAHNLANPMALRINPDVGAGHHTDVVTAGGGVKFGIGLAEVPEARRLVEQAGKKVAGLHAHIGSGVDSVEPLLASARVLLELSAAFAQLEFINFGGGISVPYQPHDQPFPLDDYGTQLAQLADATLRVRGLKAILEPRRYVVAESGMRRTPVTSRRTSGAAVWAGVDSGFNHLARPSKYGAYHHIVNCSHGSEGSLRETYDPYRLDDDVIVAGNICESGDVFTRRPDGTPVTRRIDHANIGDLLALCDAGAYGFSMASHYNARLLPPEVLVDGDQVMLIRERQTLDGLLKGQR